MSQAVLPACHPGCSCLLYHYGEPQGRVEYTVIVNCSAANLTAFPALPREVSVLDLSRNQLDQEAFNALDVVGQNYEQLVHLDLSHNNIRSLGTKAPSNNQRDQKFNYGVMKIDLFCQCKPIFSPDC